MQKLIVQSKLFNRECLLWDFFFKHWTTVKQLKYLYKMLAIHTFHCGYYQLKLLCSNLQLLWCTCGKWLITSPMRVFSTFWWSFFVEKKTVQNLKLKQHYTDMTSFVVFKIAHNIFVYMNQSWNACCGLNTHRSESISNKLITHFSSWTSLFMNFFQFVLLDKFKYSFSKLRK